MLLRQKIQVEFRLVQKEKTGLCCIGRIEANEPLQMKYLAGVAFDPVKLREGLRNAFTQSGLYLEHLCF